jgi:peptidoglycan hydrolase-like protein with peptidoglycan-binding domain
MKALRKVIVAAVVAGALVPTVGRVAASPEPLVDDDAPVNLFRAAPFPFPIMPVGMSSGGATAVVQVRLLNLGFWLKEANGENDMTTRQAVMAFQKYRGLKPTGGVDAETANALSEPQEPAMGKATEGDVVEVDLERQLAFVIQDGVTTMTLNVSTGHGGEYTTRSKNNPNIVIDDVADTPTGKYRVWRVRPDGWWEGDLGSIYRPIYFKGGIAFHGSAVVPAYPASHGCVRVSVDAMDKLWDMDVLPLHAKVHVY